MLASGLGASMRVEDLNTIRSETSSPRVCLALPVYNGEPYLTETIRSCLSQDYDNFQLLITDNASTDQTENICREFAKADKRVVYIRNERNLGAGPNYNLGFNLTTGKYFKWCASDDLLSPNYVSACVAVLEANEDAVLAYGYTQTIDVGGRPIPLVGRGMKEQTGSDGLARRFHKDLYDRASNFEIFGVFRRSALERTGLHRLYYGSDVTLVTETTLLGRFTYVPTATFYNREHPQRSINIDRNLRPTWQHSDAHGKMRPENLERFKHLVDIALRHRKTAPFLKISGVIALWTMRKTNDRIAKMLEVLMARALSKVKQ